MATVKQMNFMRRALYLACRECVLWRGGFDEGEYIRVFRDSLVSEYFDKRTYDELSYNELKQAIAIAKETMKIEIPAITSEQLASIKFYGISLALDRCNLSGLRVTINGKQPRDEKQLRAELKKRFAAKQPLPANVVSFLYTNYINPMCNAYLGREPVNPKVLYYEKLTKPEAQGLIKRLMKFWNEQNKRDDQSDISINYYSLN